MSLAPATPVLIREVRSESRQPFTFWLRVYGVAAALLAAALATSETLGGVASDGGAVFGAVNTAMFVTICILVPLLTADCLSRERRDGTLGLLLLTPLRPAGVVVAKSLVQMLRALTLLLATGPVMALAFVIGGVGWFELVNAAVLDLAAISLALGAGILVSARARSWNRAAFGSVVVSIIMAVMLSQVLVELIILQVIPLASPSGAATRPPWPYRIEFIALMTGWDGAWGEVRMRGSRAVTLSFIGTSVQGLVFGLLFLWSAIRLSARWIEENLEEAPASRWRTWVQRLFFQPVILKSYLRHRQAGMLQWNPIGWLQLRTTTARLTKWGWCLGLVLTEALLAATAAAVGLDFLRVQLFLTFVLGVGISLTSAASFGVERRSGAIELILVSPLREGQLIRGRLMGLYGQFLPALLVLGLFLIVGDVFHRSRVAAYGVDQLLSRGCLVVALSGFAVLPIVGLLHSMERRGLGSAWGRTVTLGLVLPWLLGSLTAGGYSMVLAQTWMMNPGAVAELQTRVALLAGSIVVIQGAVGILAYRRLHSLLRRRDFADR